MVANVFSLSVSQFIRKFDKLGMHICAVTCFLKNKLISLDQSHRLDNKFYLPTGLEQLDIVILFFLAEVLV